MRSNSCRSAPTSIYTLSVMDFDKKKETISEVRGQVELNLDILDADRFPNAAHSQRSSGNRLITMVKVKMKWRKIVSKNEKNLNFLREKMMIKLSSTHARMPV